MSPLYKYTAFGSNGKEVKGSLESDSVRAAREKLRTQGLKPTKIDEVVSKKSFSTKDITIKRAKKINTIQLAVMTRQLATLLGAGMPLVDSMRALSEQLDTPFLKQVMGNVRERVTEGAAFNVALEAQGDTFPKLYIRMIKSGEASGTLDMVLTRLADMLEGQAMLNRKIISAITYPVLMLFLCLGVIILLLAYVVPQISVIFKERGKALPFITEVIINISDLIRGYWWLMGIIIFFLLIIFQRYIKTTEGRYKLDKLIVTMPIFGHIFLKVATSRLATNLGTMLKSGIELLTALSISKNILSNTYLEETIKTASEGVEQGKSLSMLLSQSQKFPKILIHMTAIGEQTGSLDEMLIRVGKNMETEVEAIVAGLTSLLEPILIIFLAFIVGGILAAVMLPMLEVTSIGK